MIGCSLVENPRLIAKLMRPWASEYSYPQTGYKVATLLLTNHLHDNAPMGPWLDVALYVALWISARLPHPGCLNPKRPISPRGSFIVYSTLAWNRMVFRKVEECSFIFIGGLSKFDNFAWVNLWCVNLLKISRDSVYFPVFFESGLLDANTTTGSPTCQWWGRGSKAVTCMAAPAIGKGFGATFQLIICQGRSIHTVFKPARFPQPPPYVYLYLCISSHLGLI